MKRIVTIGIALIIPRASFAVIPVTDLENLASNLEQQFTTAKQLVTQNLQWVKQVQQYALQAQQYATEAQQLLAFVHNPSIGGAAAVISRTGLSNSLPTDLYAAQSIVSGVGTIGQGGGFSLGGITGILGSLSTMAGTTYDKNHIYTDPLRTWFADQLNNKGAALSGTEAAALSAYQDLRTHAGALPSLREEGMKAGNPLDMAAVQTQVQIEEAWHMNQLGQITAIGVAADMQDKIRQQRDEEQTTKSLQGQLTQAKAAGVPGL